MRTHAVVINIHLSHRSISIFLAFCQPVLEQRIELETVQVGERYERKYHERSVSTLDASAVTRTCEYNERLPSVLHATRHVSRIAVLRQRGRRIRKPLLFSQSRFHTDLVFTAFRYIRQQQRAIFLAASMPRIGLYTGLLRRRMSAVLVPPANPVQHAAAKYTRTLVRCCWTTALYAIHASVVRPDGDILQRGSTKR